MFAPRQYFNAELHEELRYDKALKEYSMANIRSQQTLALLNSGQQLIIVAGVVGAMILAADLVVKKKLTIGQPAAREKQTKNALLASLKSIADDAPLTFSPACVARCCFRIFEPQATG